MLSIVIPLFNEQENVTYLYDRLTTASSSWNEDYEIIFVDDGSTDNTLELLRAFSSRDQRIQIISLSRNFGHQAAISAGIKYSTGDAVIVMDGDLQDPPEELHRFLEKWREGYHVVYAVRRKRKEGIFKKAAYKAFYRLLRIIGDIEIPLDSGDFCVMDKKVVNVLNKEMTEYSRFVRGLRAYAGFRQIGVEYERQERAVGDVKYSYRKLMNLAISGLLDFSTFPLRIATYLGFIIAVPSFLVGTFFIIHRIFDFDVFGYSPSDTPGLASLAVGVFFLGGTIMMMLGIIGEYIGRMYFEVKRRPFYIIDHVFKNSIDEKSD